MDINNLAIVIPTFNRKECVDVLLAKLANQVGISINVHLIVVVDGSTDGTFDLLKTKHPNVSVVEGSGNWWWTRSINEGLKVAKERGYSNFLLMNDDTEIQEDFLTIMWNHYQRHENCIIGAISVTSQAPHKIFFSGIKSVNWASAKFHRNHKHFELYDSSTMSGVHKSVFLPGRGMLFSKSLLDRIGNFRDDKFPQYYADFDFSYRAYKAGFNVFVCYDAPIFSHVEMTAEGNKSNTSFLKLLKSFIKPMSSNNFKKTYYFFRAHAGSIYFVAYPLHYCRIMASLLLTKLGKN